MAINYEQMVRALQSASLSTAPAKASGGTPKTTNVTSASTATLMAANASRKKGTIRCSITNGTGPLYVDRVTPVVPANAPFTLFDGDLLNDDLTLGAWYGITTGTDTATTVSLDLS